MFFIGLLIACYIVGIVLAKIFMVSIHWVAFLFFPLLVPVIYWLMCVALRYFQRTDIKKSNEGKTVLQYLKKFAPTVFPSREKLSFFVFIGVFSAVVFVFLLALLANYPGYYFDIDIAVQWYQAHSGALDDWHPAIHTMLIWLVTRIHDIYGFFLGAQILFFSLLCGYMASTLRTWGFQKIWVAAFAITIISAQSTRTLMLYAYKDSIFSCLVLWSAIYLVNVVLSDGAWLAKWGNRIALALVLAFASIIRHNGIAFTVPVIGLLCILYMTIPFPQLSLDKRERMC